MKPNVQKNRMMFFGGTIAALIAIFISSTLFFATPTAHAYAVGTVPSNPTPSVGTYDVGNSFQNLISPFTGFVNNLKWNNNTTISSGGHAQTYPTVNLTPVVASGVQNILGQWASEFDNWFYGITGIQLSGILLVLLNAISWTLGLAQQVVNWLLGLFH
jgi:hypothetical protein